MKTSLDHLPEGKRRELALVVDVLRSSFDEERSTRQSPALRDGTILKIILFGSYARGDWVEDPVGRYFSDYDLLVVVADEKHTDVLEFWETAEKRLLAALASGERLRTPVSFIVHSLAEVNGQLTHGKRGAADRLTRMAGRHGSANRPDLAPAKAWAEGENGGSVNWHGSSEVPHLALVEARHARSTFQKAANATRIQAGCSTSSDVIRMPVRHEQSTVDRTNSLPAAPQTRTGPNFHQKIQ